MKKWILLFSFLVLGIALYWSPAFNKTFTNRGVASNNLARIPLNLNLSQGEERIKNIKLRLIQNLNLNFSQESAEIRLGAFQINSAEHICSEFDTVSIELKAEGVAVSGSSPTIRWSRPCRYVADDEQIEAFKLPIERLTTLPATDQSLVMDDGTIIEIMSMDDFWPEEWHLTRVELKQSATNHTIEIDSYEIYFVHNGPVAIRF